MQPITYFPFLSISVSTMASLCTNNSSHMEILRSCLFNVLNFDAFFAPATAHSHYESLSWFIYVGDWMNHLPVTAFLSNPQVNKSHCKHLMKWFKLIIIINYYLLIIHQSSGAKLASILLQWGVFTHFCACYSFCINCIKSGPYLCIFFVNFQQ